APENLSQKQSLFLAEIKWKYFLALGLIAFFTLLGFTMAQISQAKMHDDSRIINISGRQRMLSQRLALLRLTLPPEEAKAAAKSLMAEMLAAHEDILRSRFLQKSNAELETLFNSTDGISSELPLYFGLLNSDQAKPEQIYSASQKLLSLFDAATLKIQKQSEADLSYNQYLEFYLLILTLLILVLEMLLIFLPLLKHTRLQFKNSNAITEKSLDLNRLSVLGELSTSLAHEMRTSLSVVQVAAELELMSLEAGQTLTKRTIASFEKIKRQADFALSLVKSIVSQARPADREEPRSETLGSLVLTSLEILHVKTYYDSVHVNLENLDMGQVVHYRSSALVQVLTNLITNAIDAVRELPPDNRNVFVASIKIDSGVLIRVKDSGPGVPPPLHEKIFESFYTTKAEGKGTGIGLAISRKIAVEHHGYLKINPEISNSCFELFIPNEAKPTLSV
ncbi:MAG: ATP-binding protein, partial [Pseudobdellovibrio sp.]